MDVSSRKPRRRWQNKPLLTIPQILAWADAHHERTGQWPKYNSGPVYNAPGENWQAINCTLVNGDRGLPPGSSLAKVLDKHRGVRNLRATPPLTYKQILKWADAHYRLTGQWPKYRSGPVHGAPGETWCSIAAALRCGSRRLPGGSSLPLLLMKHRGVRCWGQPVTIKQILGWAKRHHKRTGRWPTVNSGKVHDAPGETWLALDGALRRGGRGLRPDSSLSRLLETVLGVHR
jgi:hypothetical protein